MMTTAILKARRRARKRIEVVDLGFKLRADRQFQISFVAYTEFTWRRCIACEADTNIYRLVPCLVYHYLPPAIFVLKI